MINTQDEFYKAFENEDDILDDNFVKNVVPSVLTFFLQHYTNMQIINGNVKLDSRLVTVLQPENWEQFKLMRQAYLDVKTRVYDTRKTSSD